MEWHSKYCSRLEHDDDDNQSHYFSLQDQESKKSVRCGKYMQNRFQSVKGWRFANYFTLFK